MFFQHSPALWRDFPELVPGLLFAEGISNDVSVDARAARFQRAAEERLAGASETEFPEIQAWRRAFSRMGLKPTQYRCASESLLRRFKKERSLPSIHPLVDLCNAVSLAFAIPVAILDVARLTGVIEVRYASGSERYLSFSGETEHPAAREVVFADDAGQAHARRWTNRQSAYSAVRDSTDTVLIVAEAMHASASADVNRLITTIADEINATWSISPRTAVLSQSSPRFAFS